MCLIGVGLQSINIFCSLMDLDQGLATNVYYALKTSTNKAIFDIVILKTILKEKEKNTKAENEPSHLTVSGENME